MNIEVVHSTSDNTITLTLIAQTIEEAQALQNLPVAGGYKITGSVISKYGVNKLTFLNKGPEILVY